jgi:hypothetical protein
VAPREGRVVEHHEVEVAAGGVLEATVAAEALEVVVAQVGSVVVVVMVFEGHEIVSASVYLRLECAHRSFNHFNHKRIQGADEPLVGEVVV